MRRNQLPAKATTLADALLAVQQGAPKIQKDAINPHFRNKYISLDSLMPQILPLLNENGIVLAQLVTHLPAAEGPVPALKTRLIHASSGESLEATAPLLLDKNNAQGVGSAITYYKRYALLSMLGLVADTDDDGQQASQGAAKAAPRKAAAKPAPKPAAKADEDEDW